MSSGDRVRLSALREKPLGDLTYQPVFAIRTCALRPDVLVARAPVLASDPWKWRAWLTPRRPCQRSIDPIWMAFWYSCSSFPWSADLIDLLRSPGSSLICSALPPMGTCPRPHRAGADTHVRLSAREACSEWGRNGHHASVSTCPCYATSGQTRTAGCRNSLGYR